MIRLLLEHGADVDARGIAREWERSVTAEPRIKIMQTGGFTPLLYAAREGCVACVEALVAGGADIDLADPDGMTPLVLALLQPQLRHGRRADRARRRRRIDGTGGAAARCTSRSSSTEFPSSRHGDLPALDEHTGLDVARLLLARGANVEHAA